MRTHLIALWFLAATLGVASPDSVNYVAPFTASPNPGLPSVTRALTPEELNQPLSFEIPLKLRARAELNLKLQAGRAVSQAEMAARHLPLPSDYQKVVDWLLAQGFQITRSDPSFHSVFARGTISRIAVAFQTEFARVTFRGRETASAISAPVLPAAIAGLCVGVNGLQPHLLLARQGALKFGAAATPLYPQQVARAYKASLTPTSGAGQTIAIIMDTVPRESDLRLFWEKTQTPQSMENVTYIKVGDGDLPAPSGEETLDVQWASAMAPGAKIRLYATCNLEFSSIDLAYHRLYQDALVDPSLRILSLSYGSPEKYTPRAQLETDAQYLALLSSLGMTILAASGDGGSNPSQIDGAYNIFSQRDVMAPAADPNVTAVGGTTLRLNVDGTVASEIAWSPAFLFLCGASGGGLSEFYTRPAWQKGKGLTSGNTRRAVPDLAVLGDPLTGGVIVLDGQVTSAGGTSLSAPLLAGLCAGINQARAAVGKPVLGHLAAQVYPLIGTTCFRDITEGNIGAYKAVAGYDCATGLGVPDISALMRVLVEGALPVIPPTVTTYANKTVNAKAGTSPTLTIPPLPGASYTWTLNGAPVGGTASSLSLPSVGTLDAGTYKVFARVGEFVTATASFTLRVSSTATVAGCAASGITGPGSQALTGGFTLQGTTPGTVLIRGLGPALTALGVTEAVPDPQIAVYDGQNRLVASNAGWANDSRIITASSKVGAAPLVLGSTDAAVAITLPVGTYTVQVTSKSAATGRAMLQVFLVP